MYPWFARSGKLAVSARGWRAAVALLALVWAAAPGQAQGLGNWPERVIRLIAPYPPGGPSDIVARSVIAQIAPQLHQAIVLENKPGAGGNLGAAEVARAAPDGYTWLVATDTTLTINPHVYPKLPFKPGDLTPVMTLSYFSQTLVCHPGVGVKSLAEWVAKARSGAMSYASGGAGVPGHMAMELLLARAGVEMQHIPYKGPAPAAQDVIGGQVPCGFLAGPTVLPQIRAGKLVALAVSGKTRSPVLPEVPSVAEAGYPGYDATFSLMLFAPRGTPEAIVTAFRKLVAEGLNSDDMKEKLRATDQTVGADTPVEAAASLAARSKTWGEVVKKIKLSLD